MKKFILSLALVAGMASALNAQVDGKAIGLRFANGAEISYQHPLGNVNRLELDLGIISNSYYDHRLGLTGIYHWVWDLSSITAGLKWYAGPGATLGFAYTPNFYSYSHYGFSSGLFIGIAGQIGAEYNFTFPLQVSVDYRPAIYIVNPDSNYSGAYGDICFSARYRF